MSLSLPPWLEKTGYELVQDRLILPLKYWANAPRPYNGRYLTYLCRSAANAGACLGEVLCSALIPLYDLAVALFKAVLGQRHGARPAVHLYQIVLSPIKLIALSIGSAGAAPFWLCIAIGYATHDAFATTPLPLVVAPAAESV
jgi:hypothetical protein